MIVGLPRFYHVGLTAVPSNNQQALDAAMASVSIDWMRYAYNCYFIWTTKSASQIGGAILTLDGANVQGMNFFVAEVNVLTADNWGFLPQWAWDWFRKDRRQFPGDPPPPPIRPLLGPGQ